ncbi:hypothetical protein ACEU6E_05615 [Halorutilales archaeon Cl-col2-1]
MGQSDTDTVKFRSDAIKKLLEKLDEIRVGGVNESEVSREAMRRLLPDILSDEEKIEFYEMYRRGDVSEKVVRIALGEDFDQIQKTIENTRELADEGTEKYLAE